MLSLSEAIKDGRIDEFIAQEEMRGTGPIDRAEFDRAVAEIIKAQQSKDQTSRFASGDGSTGKKIRRGSDQDASG